MSEYIEKPWGRYKVLDQTENYKIKIIQVNVNCRLSLQSHKFRSQIWTIVEGNAKIYHDRGYYDFNFGRGQSITIEKNRKHRIQNVLDQKLIFIEYQYGQYFGEDDIVRYEDDYGRI